MSPNAEFFRKLIWIRRSTILPGEGKISADRWNAALYDQKHSFVFEYGRDLLSLLNPQPGERILDLGCGTGRLTKAIADTGALVVGIDNSPSMIAAARGEYPHLEFFEADAGSFSFPSLFDAIFSNAVLHWILEAELVVQCVSRSLKPGGRFVAEFGGKGNVAGIAKALRETLREYAQADESPWWYYPTIGEYATLLEKHGLEVTFATLFDRLTKLEDGAAGLRNWIEMFRGEVLSSIEAEAKERILTDVESKLRGALFRDGSWYADYRRLRIAAFKT
jgi:trans-aconitate 2-methyltransferase